jgi:hypothetical protein
MKYEVVILTYRDGNVQRNEFKTETQVPEKHCWSLNDFSEMKKPDTGDPLHTQEPVTVASFRTWRDWRECVARDRCLTYLILAFRTYSSLSRRNRQQ